MRPSNSWFEVKGLIERFCPDEIHVAIYDVELSRLWDQGIRGIILDVDNTIVGWGSQVMSPKTVDWINQAKQKGFRLCIASNGVTKRVEAMAELLRIPAIAKAVKPRKKPFRSALTLLETTPEQTAVIGDQIFTDVFGGNRLDMYTILINPVSSEELRSTKLMRRVERSVMRRLHRKGYLSDQQLASRFQLMPATTEKTDEDTED